MYILSIQKEQYLQYQWFKVWRNNSFYIYRLKYGTKVLVKKKSSLWLGIYYSILHLQYILLQNDNIFNKWNKTTTVTIIRNLNIKGTHYICIFSIYFYYHHINGNHTLNYHELKDIYSVLYEYSKRWIITWKQNKTKKKRKENTTKKLEIVLHV